MNILIKSKLDICLKRLKCLNSLSLGTVATDSKPTSDTSEKEGHLDGKPSWVYFSKARTGHFLQQPPTVRNQYTQDAPLQNYLRRHIPKDVFKSFEGDLVQFGHRTATDIVDLSHECEKQPPYLIQQNSWGERIDQVWTCNAWKTMHDISAEEGLIAIGYERKFQEYSRLYQMAKLYLYAPSSGLYSCPLAMTDGAAKTIEALCSTNTLPEHLSKVLQTAYNHLISRNPEGFWTSGQWMTERKGGSDVANGTETIAVRQSDGLYKLYGYKWFTSAIDSDMSLTLAREADENGDTVEGTKGLSLFYLETKLQNGKLNNIQVVRLKDKLGTRQLPTAELLLDGTLAYKISEDGRGVAGISTMLSLTRLHNTCAAVSGMRRGLNLARDYAHKREAFGNLIARYPLHIQTLSRLEVEVRAALLLFFEMARLLGKLDCNTASDEEKLLFRILTPIAKLYTAKQAMMVGSEVLESFGGQGYMEDSGLPLLLRDAQVLPIWEGTTNILSLDVLRSIAKTNGEVFHALVTSIIRRMEFCKNPELEKAQKAVKFSIEDIGLFLRNNQELAIPAARDLSFSLARTFMGALLIENANDDRATKQDVIAAARWCLGQDLTVVTTNHRLGSYKDHALDEDYNLIMDGYNP